MFGIVLVRLLVLVAVELLMPLALETPRDEEIEAEAALALAAIDVALLGLIVMLVRGAMVIFFIAVTGGSGRGLLLTDGMATGLFRLMGDSLRTGARGGAIEDF